MHSGPSVKHVLGVQEWSYVVPEKTFFSKIEFGSGWHPPTVGQEAVELICKNARKMRQNEAMSFWPLLTTKMNLIWMKVKKKWLSAKKRFWPCQCIFQQFSEWCPCCFANFETWHIYVGFGSYFPDNMILLGIRTTSIEYNDTGSQWVLTDWQTQVVQEVQEPQWKIRSAVFLVVY